MKIVTANRLSDGRVIYVGVDNQPVERIDQASMLDDAAVDVDQWPTMGQLIPVAYSTKNPDKWGFAPAEPPPPPPPPPV